ncbi:MAG: hypothetical protein CMJ19_20835 [Phycisphaeraceae bacterium]|nr:hypothetical protein [Phycisphaeraceae bacterium]
MWFDRARFGHLDDDAFEALHHYAKQQDEQKPESKESDEAQSVPVKREKQEKVGTDSVLKLTDFAHLKPSSKAARQTPSIKPIKDPHDGRWVLAVRTAESIRHGKLAADKRDRLLKLGKLLGLSPMDSHRIISVIVAHAESGIAPAQLTRQSFAELEQAAPPPMRSVGKINWMMVAMSTILLMLIEFAVLFAWFK